jgi:hypothetical protein
MTDADERDRLSQRLRAYLPRVDTDHAWDKLQTEIAHQEFAQEKHRATTEGPRPRRRIKIAAVATGGVAVIAAVVIGVTLGLSGQEGSSVADVPTTLSQASPTTEGLATMTTSPDWAARSQAATQKALRLGEAVVSYFEGSLDLTSVQDLVEESGRAGLAEMLGLLSAPTGADVAKVAGTDLGTEIRVVLTFQDAEAAQRDFTLSIVTDGDTAAITAIEPHTAAP